MSALTKKHRIIWDEDKKLSMDPYTEYPSNSVTHTNTTNYFESNTIEDIENKINELELTYNENDEEYSEEDI